MTGFIDHEKRLSVAVGIAVTGYPYRNQILKD